MSTLLIIDDHSDTLTTIKRVLQREFPRLKLLTATSGEEGLNILSKTPPDVVIVDLALPGIDGLEVCRQIRLSQTTSYIPIVILTGVHLESQDKIKGLNAGGDVYLAKPIDQGELVAQVRAMLRIKALEDQVLYQRKDLETKVREQAIHLLENESQFRFLFNNLTVGLYRTTPEGEVLIANEALIRLLGYDSFEEIAGRNLNDEKYEPQYDRTEFIEKLKKEGHIQGLEAIWKRKDGEEIYVRESVSLVRDHAGEVLYFEGTVEDITRERKIRQALQEERQLFRAGPTVIFKWAAGEDRIPVKYVSPNVTQLYGYSVQQLIEGEITYSDLIHPEDFKRVIQEVEDYIKAGSTHFSQRYRILDARGKEHWVHDLTMIVRDRHDQIKSFVGYITEITEMVTLSQDLVRKDRLIRNVLKQALEGIIVTDESGKLVEWSQGMEEITGVPADDVIGRPIWDVQMDFMTTNKKSSAKMEQIANRIQSILETGDLTSVEQSIRVPIKTAQGEEKIVQQIITTFRTETRYGLVGFFRDETEVVQTARNLEETQKRYATLFQASPDGFILENKDGTIIDCNPASCRILGFDPDELVGMNVQELTSPENRSKVRANIKAILKTGYLRHDVENKRRDGSTVFLELHEVKVPLPNGEDGILVIHRDITERKRVEAELRQRDRILSVITEAAEQVLRAESWSDCVDPVLAKLGEAVGVTRVTLFENQISESGERLTTIRGEWAAKGFGFKDRKKAQSFRNIGLDRWERLLEKGEKIVARISDMSPKDQIYFKKNKSKSLLAIPIYTGSEWWGLLRFDDGRSDRHWSEVEVESLTIAANLLGSSIQRDISDAALKHLAESVSVTPEESFFESLVLELSLVLNCDFAFVGELINQEPEQIQTVAFAQDRKLSPNFVYDLKNTPCENVVGQCYQHYSNHVQDQFPDDHLLREMGIACYYGMPLFSTQNEPLGIVVVMSRQAMKNEWLVESLLKVFAVRAGSELERRIAYEKIRESEEKFRIAFRTSPDAVNINRLSDGLYVEINEGFTAITGYTWEDVEGKTSDELNMWYNPEDRNRLVAGLMKNRVCNNLEAKFRFKDGRVHTGLMSARIINMNGEPHILSITRDIEDRKQDEIRLMESETRYRKLVDLAPVAIGIHSKGVWRFINKEAVRLMGYDSYEELVGQSVLDVVHPDSRDFVLKRIESMIKTGKPLVLAEEKLLRRDGNTVYALVTSTPIQYKGDTAYQVIAVDITALKEAESEIQILNKAVQQSPSIVMITGLDGNIEYVNPKFTEVTGWKSEEVIGKKANILKSGHTTQEEYQELWTTISAGKIWQGEFRNKRKDGSLYWESVIISPVVDDQGKTQHFLAVKEDITEKKETLAKLEESEAKFRSLFEESLDTIYLSAPDGQILDINPAGEALFGYSREELLRLNIHDFYVNPEATKAFMEQIEKEGFVRDFKVVLKKKDGSAMTCLMTAKVVQTEDQESPVFSGLIHDITEREKDRQRLEEALEKAQEGERVKTLFLANMSHEIRTPLNSVLGFVDLLRKDDAIKSPEERNEVIDIIQASGERLMRTVHEVLDISQIEAGTFTLNPEDLDLNEIINQVVKEHSATIKMRDLELVNLSEVRKPIIHGDKESILKAISNLVDNAIKYTPSGTIQVYLKSEKDRYALYIKDTGIGISREYMKHMYDVFSQESTGFTKKYQGLGLGLSITKRCLDMNSVEISVESEKDVGTTFRLEFIPVTHSTASRPSSSDSVQMEELISEEILDDILVVEDDPSSQLLMEYFLKSRYNLYYAVSVQEAKDVLKKIKPKVVLLDLSLAGQEDGLNLVRDMRKSKEWKSIPVIALTAHAFVSDREQCIKAGCTDYLSKPVKQAALLKRIRQVSSQED